MDFQHRSPNLAPHLFRHLPCIVAVLLLCSCASTPLERSKVTPTTEPSILPQPDQVPHLTFAGVNQHEPPSLLWSVKIAPLYRPYGDPLISPDGHWLVLAADKTVLVFDLQERRVVAQRPCPGPVVRLFFDRTAPRLIGIFNADERPHPFFKEGQTTIGFWSLPTLEFTSRPLLPDFGPATNAAITYKQDRVLTVSPNGVIGVFELATGRELTRFNGHKHGDVGPYVTHKLGGVAVSHDDQVAISFTGGPDPNGRLRRWRLADSQEIPTGPEGYDYDRNGGYLMNYTPDGRTVLMSASNWGLMLAKAEDGHGIYNYLEFGYHDYDTSQPNLAVTRANSGRCGVINAQTGQLLFTAEHKAEPPAQYPTLHWAILSPDGRTVYTAANYGYILAWDFAAASSRPPELLSSGTGWTSFIALKGAEAQTLEVSPGPRSLDRVIKWDLAKRALLSSAPAESFPREEYMDAGYNPLRWRMGTFVLNGNICTLTGRDGEARAFEPLTGRILFHLGAPGAKPDPRIPPDLLKVFSRGLAVAASPDGTLLAVGGNAGPTLTLWDPRDGHFLKTLDGHAAGITSVVFTPDGRRFISGDKEGQLLIRTVQSTRAAGGRSGAVAWLPLPAGEARGYVAHTCANANGTLIAAAYATGGPYAMNPHGSVTMWQDSQQGEWRQLFTCKLPRAPSRIALSPDSRLLAVSLLNFNGKSNGIGESYGDVFIIDARTGELRFVLNWVDARDLVFLNDRQLATAGNGVQVWTLPGR